MLFTLTECYRQNRIDKGTDKAFIRDRSLMESSGGVVYRQTNSGFELVLCGRDIPRMWCLPKGTPEKGENRLQTALREVSEETGLQVRVQMYIGDIHYQVLRIFDNTKVQKTVHYYLMNAIGGDLSKHDHEFDEVGWFSVDDAINLLSYENEVKIVEQGIALAKGQTKT